MPSETSAVTDATKNAPGTINQSRPQMGQKAGEEPKGQAPMAASSPANYTGRGPKGYKRSDERMRDELFHKLTRHPGVDASDIDLEAKDGILTLCGSVETRFERHIADDIAHSIAGVKVVHNMLQVRDPLATPEDLLRGTDAFFTETWVPAGDSPMGRAWRTANRESSHPY